MAQNRGEWSELYTIFYLLLNEKLKIVNSNLELKTENIFKVKEILSKNKEDREINFKIQENNILLSFNDNKIIIDKKDLLEQNKKLFKKISVSSKRKGAFEIKEINDWLSKKGITFSLKASSTSKEDILLLNYDEYKNIDILLGYSIKSQLGSPATILNASSHTNFKYIVKGLKKEYVEEINKINTSKKLLDRLKKIEELGGKIEFKEVVSKKFEKNLELIDSLLPKVLGEVLLNSYKKETKDLKKLFSMSTVYTESISNKKLKDFLSAISFGMMPSKEWDGENRVKGGILLVSLDENIYVLDLVYYTKDVKEYLLNNTKLDSPSSSRYNMLNLEEENGEIIFTLNLQVRYKN